MFVGEYWIEKFYYVNFIKFEVFGARRDECEPIPCTRAMYNTPELSYDGQLNMKVNNVCRDIVCGGQYWYEMRLLPVNTLYR